MKQMETTQKVIGENTFFIRPFAAFTAANISGDLVKTLTPVVGALISSIGVSGGASTGEAVAGVMDMEIEEVAPKLGDALSGLSGDTVERLMKKLIITHGNVSVEGPITDGSTKVLDLDLANEVFCTDLQDMYALCIEVVKVNFKGFFSKIAGQFGDLRGVLGTQTASSDTAT